MTGVMKVTGRTGHTEVEWDTDDKKSVKDAEKEFQRLRAQGHIAFAIADIHGQKKGEPVQDFDPEHQEYLIAAPMAGG